MTCLIVSTSNTGQHVKRRFATITFQKKTTQKLLPKKTSGLYVLNTESSSLEVLNHLLTLKSKFWVIYK